MKEKIVYIAIVAILVVLVLGIYLGLTGLVVYAICWCFGWTFSWKVTIGVFIITDAIYAVLGSAIKNNKSK